MAIVFFLMCHFDGLVQDYSNSNANALELLQSWSKPLIWCPTNSDESQCAHL